MKKDYFKIANKNFLSRLIVGTGKYKSMKECAKAIKYSGAEIVTVAVRRVNISDKSIIIKIKVDKIRLNKKQHNQYLNSKILNKIMNKNKKIKFEGVSINSKEIKKEISLLLSKDEIKMAITIFMKL